MIRRLFNGTGQIVGALTLTPLRLVDYDARFRAVRVTRSLDAFLELLRRAAQPGAAVRYQYQGRGDYRGQAFLMIARVVVARRRYRLEHCCGTCGRKQGCGFCRSPELARRAVERLAVCCEEEGLLLIPTSARSGD